MCCEELAENQRGGESGLLVKGAVDDFGVGRVIEHLVVVELLLRVRGWRLVCLDNGVERRG